MKELSASVITQLDAQQKRPALLFEIYLTGLTLRYVAYMTNVTFPTGGNVYTAKAISFGGVSQTLEGQIGRVAVNFDNVSKDMTAYIDAYDFEGRTLSIKRIFLDAIGSSAYYNELFRGYMEQPKEITRQSVTISATEGKPLQRRVLLKKYDRECNLTFGGTACNTDGNANLASLKATGTADSGTTTTLVDNALTQVDDYWNYGSIILVKGGITYNRKVYDFDAGTDTITLDLGLPVAIDNTTTYTVYKGCAKTWDACQSNQAYGPSADNKANFGGFMHIGIWRES